MEPLAVLDLRKGMNTDNVTKSEMKVLPHHMIHPNLLVGHVFV